MRAQLNDAKRRSFCYPPMNMGNELSKKFRFFY